MDALVTLLRNCSALFVKAPGKVDGELMALHTQVTVMHTNSGDRKQEIISTLKRHSFEVLDSCVCIADAVIPRILALINDDSFFGNPTDEIVQNAVIGFALTMSLNKSRERRDAFYRYISRNILFLNKFSLNFILYNKLQCRRMLSIHQC